MHLDVVRRHGARAAVVAGLAGALAFAGSAAPAFADTQADLASAQTKLSHIGKRYAELQSSLQQAGADLETTKGKIDETAQKLSAAQETLSDSVAVDYKTGGAKLSTVVLGATNFSDLISRVMYMNKVSDAQADAIRDVKDLKSELESQQADQEQRLKDTQAQVDEAAENQKQAEALVNSLSAEVKAELEAKAAQDAALAAGLKSSEDAKSAPAGGTITGDQKPSAAVKPQPAPQSTQPTQPSATPSTPSSTPDATPSPAPAPTPSKPSTTTNSGSSLPSNPTGGSPIAIALQYAGTPYIYGSASPANGGFDCSGLVQFAYAQCGISLPRTDSAQRSYIQSNGFFTTDVNQLSYGDLVFFPGHVAFYVGNGQIYGAQAPGSPTGTADMRYFGTFLGGGHL